MSDIFEDQLFDVFEDKSSDELGNQSSDVFEDQSSDVLGNQSSDVFEDQSSDVLGNQSSDVFEVQLSDVFEEVCDPELILDDNDLDLDEKCNYFILSKAPTYDPDVYANLLLFFWNSFTVSDNAAACFLKVLQNLPISNALSFMNIDDIISVLQNELNPVNAKINLIISPIVPNPIYPFEALMEQAIDTACSVFIQLIEKYIHFYFVNEEIRPEHIDVLINGPLDILEYKNSLYDMLLAACHYEESLETVAYEIMQ